MVRLISGNKALQHCITEKPTESGPETVAEGLSACDKGAIPLVHQFLTILFTLPISTASTERSFSIIWRLKTCLRSRMGEERLTGLALPNIHRDIAVSVGLPRLSLRNDTWTPLFEIILIITVHFIMSYKQQSCAYFVISISLFLLRL